MASRPIRIVVDHREAPSGVLSLLREREDVTAIVHRLALGDFEVDERFLFERKTLSDLAQSVKDGRLFSQACRLANASRWTAIILEGTGRDLVDSGMRREALQGALITTTLFLGVPLMRSRDLAETVRVMIYAARQGRAVISGSLPRKGRRFRDKRRLQTHILQGLPGVGPERAKRLLDHFGSVEAVLTADPRDLASVSGIGTGTAETIRWAVEEQATPYAASS
jgi:ERCC4-type nuclease